MDRQTDKNSQREKIDIWMDRHKDRHTDRVTKPKYEMKNKYVSTKNICTAKK